MLLLRTCNLIGCAAVAIFGRTTERRTTQVTERRESGPVLFYDGSCGLCASALRFILRHERTNVLQFASLQGALGRALLEQQPELRAVDSVVLVEKLGAKPLTKSAAALAVAAQLRMPWRLVRLFRAVPRGVGDALYDLIARHRHQVWPGEQCAVPEPDVRERFLG
jgi:predicted DCC family thiol-disulfide oxidoreductase YuxK